MTVKVIEAFQSLCTESDRPVDYKNIHALQKFVTRQGKIVPRWRTQLSAKQHRRVTKFIKQGRVLGLLPFLNKR